MSKTIVKCWTFPSSSSDATYQTLLYSDQTTSCECPGWVRRVAPDGSRSCKHTRSVDMGSADSEALRHHTYLKVGNIGRPEAPAISVAVPKQQPSTIKEKHGTKKKDGGEPANPYGQRRLI